MKQPSQPIFRFAPSPNGRLHLGHAYSALYTDHWARAMGGVALLRIEDVDKARCRPEYVEGIFEDLQWLGLRYPEPVRRQSQHFEEYRAAADRLRAMGLIYPCFCTRAQVRAASDGRTDPDGAPLYPGTCRHLPDAERAEKLAAGLPVQWRLDMAQAIGRGGDLAFFEAMPTPDAAPVPRAIEPERWGDVVIVRKDTPTSYHLSVVTDDAVQRITHITRGQDLYAATDIHRLLQALLELPSPVYTHHELVLDRQNAKLAKSIGSESLADLRDQGWRAADVRRRLEF